LLAWLPVAAFGGLLGYLLLARWFWPAEILCHFRPHFGGLALIAAAVTLALRLRAQSIALSALAVFCAWPTLALCMPNGALQAPGPSLRVASANLLWGSKSFDALERWLEREDPALAFVCEIDLAARDRLEGLRSRYPHQLLAPPAEEWSASTWGRALISRLPLAEPATHWPGPILAARVTLDGRELRILGAHPVRPGRAAMTRSRNLVLAALGELAGEQDEVVVLGDLNVTEASPLYSELLEAGALADTRAVHGPMGTWRVRVPRLRLDLRPLRLPIDHVLIGRDLVALDRRLGPDIGSDHLPVVADLAWRDRAPVTEPR
jgi:endonuclease/exonuclease/phosphatase (EEP) superfamily protein YafD